MRNIIIVILVSFFCLTIVQGQTTFSSLGGNLSGSGGSITYTIGQIVFMTFSGTEGSVAQGVQQPFEISIVTASDNNVGILLECKVYPNPTRGLIILTIKPFDHKNLRYQLYDLNGVLLQDKKIESEVTDVSMERRLSSIYFLKVINDKQEVKVFKIIKN